MEQSNYEMRESKLIRHGQRVSVGTLVFSLIAALYALSCVLLQYGVIPLEGAGRIALIAAGGRGDADRLSPRADRLLPLPQRIPAVYGGLRRSETPS